VLNALREHFHDLYQFLLTTHGNARNAWSPMCKCPPETLRIYPTIFSLSSHTFT
jgi:hypothetical protein